MHNNQQQIAGAIIIAGVLIAGAVLLKGNNSTNVINSDGVKVSDVKVRAISNEEHILGNINSKVVVIEYSDTECPYCKIFHATMHQVVKDRDIAWVYRHNPLPQLHKKALKEAEATECAWEQGGNEGFWAYTDELYKRTQSNDRLEISELPKIAEFVGLDVSSFTNCLESGKYADKVQKDVEDGVKAGARGTPFSLIQKNGKTVDTINGAQPLETVLQKLDQVLK